MNTASVKRYKNAMPSSAKVDASEQNTPSTVCYLLGVCKSIWIVLLICLQVYCIVLQLTMPNSDAHLFTKAQSKNTFSHLSLPSLNKFDYEIKEGNKGEKVRDLSGNGR
jgi:hypothetical protein